MQDKHACLDAWACMCMLLRRIAPGCVMLSMQPLLLLQILIGAQMMGIGCQKTLQQHRMGCIVDNPLKESIASWSLCMGSRVLSCARMIARHRC